MNVGAGLCGWPRASAWSGGASRAGVSEGGWSAQQSALNPFFESRLLRSEKNQHEKQTTAGLTHCWISRSKWVKNNQRLGLQRWIKISKLHMSTNQIIRAVAVHQSLTIVVSPWHIFERLFRDKQRRSAKQAKKYQKKRSCSLQTWSTVTKKPAVWSMAVSCGQFYS